MDPVTIVRIAAGVLCAVVFVVLVQRRRSGAR
jgi:hypothetical protein